MEAKTILVVDDEFGNAEVLLLVLKEEGYRAVSAANGRQGLEMLSRLKVDLVILDLMMPIMNGAEMAAAMRASPQFSDIPILMISGLSEGGVRQQFDDYDAFLR
ncbi:MAG: response regulator, partial [Gammaproteobacteria bacterium]